MSLTTTRAPCRASNSAAARPIPLPDPGTIATFPFNNPSIETRLREIWSVCSENLYNVRETHQPKPLLTSPPPATRAGDPGNVSKCKPGHLRHAELVRFPLRIKSNNTDVVFNCYVRAERGRQFLQVLENLLRHLRRSQPRRTAIRRPTIPTQVDWVESHFRKLVLVESRYSNHAFVEIGPPRAPRSGRVLGVTHLSRIHQAPLILRLRNGLHYEVNFEEKISERIKECVALENFNSAQAVRAVTHPFGGSRVDGLMGEFFHAVDGARALVRVDLCDEEVRILLAVSNGLQDFTLIDGI